MKHFLPHSKSNRLAKWLTPAGTVLALTAIAVAWAAAPRPQKPVPPTEPQKKEGESRPWHITFDVLVHNDATGEGEATNVVATSDQDTVIRADLFRWNDKTRTARATGNLHMSDEKTEGTADLVEIDYRKEKRLMVLTGHVRLVLKPRNKPAEAAPAEGKTEPGTPAKGSPTNGNQAGQPTGTSDDEDIRASLREYPIEVTCDRVEYEYARDKRHSVLTGNFRAVQKLKDHTRTLTAERAEWFGLEERVVLKGPVKLEDTKGRKGETPEDVEIFTQEGKEGLKLRKGSYTMPVEEEGEGAAPPPSESKPTETKPPETKPGESKPPEGKPGDSKPAERGPGAAR